MKTNICINQIFFRPEQAARLDTAFVPFDNSRSNKPLQYEYGVMCDIHDRQLQLQAELTGVVSYKFVEKTRVSPADFLRWIDQNPGYDVYFINPFPHESYFGYNIWDHGENCHPGIISLAQEAIDATGAEINLSALPRSTKHNLLFCNFWVGTAAFWYKYMKFTRPLAEYMMSKPEKYFSAAKYHEGVHAPYFPFITERLFTTLLSTDPSIKSLAWQHDEDSVVNRINEIKIHNIHAQVKPCIDLLDKILETNENMAIKRSLFNEITRLAWRWT